MGDICIADAVNWGHSLNRGLVSWWLALPGQQRGVMFRDLCRRNDGTLTNGPTWQGAKGRPNGWGSLSFDGSDDYAALPATFGLFGGSLPWTFSIWVRPAVVTGLQFIWHPRGERDVHVKLNNNDVVANFWDGADHDATASAAAAIGVWVFIAAVWDAPASLFRLYINGSAIATTATGTPNVVTDTSTFATQFYSGIPHNSFTGELDDGRIFNRALSASEVSQLDQLSRRGYPGLLNRVRRKVYSFQEGGAAAAYPWHYYQQMMAG